MVKQVFPQGTACNVTADPEAKLVPSWPQGCSGCGRRFRRQRAPPPASGALGRRLASGRRIFGSRYVLACGLGSVGRLGCFRDSPDEEHFEGTSRFQGFAEPESDASLYDFVLGRISSFTSLF